MDHADKMVADSDAASTADSDAASTAVSGESWWATEWISTASAGALDLASAGGDVLLASAGVIGFGFTSAWEYLTDTGFRQKSMKPLLAVTTFCPKNICRLVQGASVCALRGA